jgi:hypothetical protein
LDEWDVRGWFYFRMWNEEGGKCEEIGALIPLVEDRKYRKWT